MSRKRIGKEPLTNAEKQRRYRAKQKTEIETLKTAARLKPAPDIAALRESIKKELRETWEPEIKKERIKEQRKRAKETAKQADFNFGRGRYFGIIQAAAFFIGQDRADITRAVLAFYAIDRELAERILQEDKRTRSLTLATLDRANAWDTPPKLIK
jgi:hypothetical protein